MLAQRAEPPGGEKVPSRPVAAGGNGQLDAAQTFLNFMPRRSGAFGAGRSTLYELLHELHFAFEQIFHSQHLAKFTARQKRAETYDPKDSQVHIDALPDQTLAATAEIYAEMNCMLASDPMKKTVGTARP